MRKIIVSTFMSLDGVIDNPMWTMPYWNDEIAKFQHDDMKVVVITAYPHLAEGDVNERADYVMHKPISPIELMTFIDTRLVAASDKILADDV